MCNSVSEKKCAPVAPVVPVAPVNPVDPVVPVKPACKMHTYLKISSSAPEHVKKPTKCPLQVRNPDKAGVSPVDPVLPALPVKPVAPVPPENPEA